MKKALDLKSVDEMKFSKRIMVKAIVIYILVLCLGCFSVLVFIRGLRFEKEYEFKYSETNNVDYKVYLKENDYYEEEFLGKGGKYIASLIDKINIEFGYKLMSDDMISGNYDYHVTATIEAKEKGKEIIIWSKDETIFEGELTEYKETNLYEINTNVDINYNKFNAIMSEFRNAYGVSLDGELVVSLHVDNNIVHKLENNNIETKALSTVRIPLIEKMLEIELDYEDSKINSNIVKYKDKPWLHYLLIGCGLILFGYYLYLSFRILKLIFDIYNSQNKYQKLLKKIFSNYDQIIVKVNQFPKFGKKSVMDVSSFDDLLDAQSELREPILYNETIINQNSVFMVIKDDKVFRYIVKYTDLS